MSKEAKILIGIAVVVIASGIVLFIKGNPQPAAPGNAVDSQSLVRDTSYMTGLKTAKVTLVEFGDYQCPACEVAYPIVKQVVSQYQSNANFNFVWREYPLTQIHPNAMLAAEAAEAAGAQGKYFEMHDLLYDHQKDWAESTTALDMFVSYAQQLGLDTGKFKTAVQSNQFSDIIAADQKDGDGAGVKGTPTFYLNGKLLGENAMPTLDEFKKAIDEALK